MSVLYELPFASLVKVFASIPVVLAGPEPPFSRLKEDTDDTRQLVADFACAAKLYCGRGKTQSTDALILVHTPEDGLVLRVKMRTAKKSHPPRVSDSA